MFLDKIVEADTDREFLNNLANTAERPHALLLDYGRAGIDPELVGSFAKYILCTEPSEQQACGKCNSCKSFDKNIHPDFHVVVAEEKANKIIKIEQIKELLTAFSYAPNTSALRVCVIKDCQQLNAEAGNALLKMLEEPPGECLFVLTCNNYPKVLPTIRSRVLLWQMHPPKAEQMLRKMDDLNLSVEQRTTLLNLASYDWERASFFATEELQDIRMTAFDFVRCYTGGNLFQESLQMDGAKSSWKKASERGNFQWFVFFLTYYLRDLLFLQNECSELVYNIDKKTALQEMSQAVPGSSLLELLERLAEYERMCALNINTKMLMDNLFVQLL